MSINRDLANIISGGFTSADIPNLDASKITSGTIDNARITLDANEVPNIDASKIASGTISASRLGSGTADATTFLRGDNTFAEAGGGKVLQVIQTFKANAFTTNSGSFVDITGLNVSITPSSTSSKILILASFIVSNGSGGYQTFINLVRGATNLAQSTGATNNATISTIQGGDNLNGVSVSFLDTPSTTSSTNYKFQMKTVGGSTGAIGRRGGSTADGASSTIIAIEIAG